MAALRFVLGVDYDEATRGLFFLQACITVDSGRQIEMITILTVIRMAWGSRGFSNSPCGRVRILLSTRCFKEGHSS